MLDLTCVASVVEKEASYATGVAIFVLPTGVWRLATSLQASLVAYKRAKSC